MSRPLATGTMAAGGTLRDAPAPEWTRDEPTADLFTGDHQAEWLERIRARAPRLEVSCQGGTYQGRACRAHRFQGSEHPVKPCDLCGQAALEHEVRAVDGTPGQLLEQDGQVMWRPA